MKEEDEIKEVLAILKLKWNELDLKKRTEREGRIIFEQITALTWVIDNRLKYHPKLKIPLELELMPIK